MQQYQEPSARQKTTTASESALFQAAVLLLFAAVPTALTARLHLDWKAPGEFNEISASAAHADASNLILVDVRNTERFESGHAQGALGITPETYDSMLDLVRAGFTGAKRIVVYGEGTGSKRAQQIARQLRKDLGSNRIFLLEGGWAAWPRN
jgi:rhodanese-related sulfurtransferase